MKGPIHACRAKNHLSFQIIQLYINIYKITLKLIRYFDRSQEK